VGGSTTATCGQHREEREFVHVADECNGEAAPRCPQRG
jgi:hypothetical protein